MHLAALGANRRRSPWLGKTGRPTDPPLDRRTGEGRVDATPGHYRDALAKGNIVHHLLPAPPCRDLLRHRLRRCPHNPQPRGLPGV